MKKAFEEGVTMSKFESITGKVYYAGISIVLISFFALFSIRTHVYEYIIAGSVLLLLVFLSKRWNLSKTEFEAEDRWIQIKIWLITFISRMVYCTFVNDKLTQRNDFEILLSEAGSGRFIDQLEYYRIYAHKLLFPLILHKLHFRNQMSIYLAQCVIMGLCSVLIYGLGKMLLDEKGARIAALIYIIWPGQLIYAGIITEEHVAALLTLFLIWGLFKIIGKVEEKELEKKDFKRIGLYSVLLGCVFGLSCFFKDWGVIILVASLISLLWLIPHIKWMKNRLFILAMLLIFILMRSVVSSVILSHSEKILGASVGNNVVVAQMYATLDPNTTGEYNEQGNNEYYQIVSKHNYNYKEANAEAISILKGRILADLEKMPKFLISKGVTAYVDDASLLFWGLVTSAKDDETFYIYRAIIQILWHLSILFYAIVVLLVIIGGVVKPNNRKTFLAICIVGAICVSLLIENHGRYKYSIEPVWCLLASAGLKNLFELKKEFENSTS